MRQNPDLFHSIRRGVRSMKILSDNGTQGMVPYRKTFEIPAFVRSKVVKEACRILRRAGIILYYLPAYSPELNDIEGVFGAI